ncbi:MULTISPECIES: hypothetical protein [Paenibacillus]|uniref:hypothetical protein n=1 Tax=Paenibacillus TaxID=44249 RepID=UPI00096E5F9A|nr:hypothetical protein [Paenibacillus odorifer]OMD06461.1 hypothetical protein BJP50_11125 [Paenibacillus odorifer]
MGITAKAANQQIADTIASVFSAFEQAEAEVQYRDDECDDLKHLFEFLPDDHPERCGLVDRFTENRRKRRIAKEDVEQLKPLVDMLRHNKSFNKDLSQALQTINTALTFQAKRYYRLKVLTEFGEVLEHRPTSKKVSNVTHTTIWRGRRVRNGINL